MGDRDRDGLLLRSLLEKETAPVLSADEVSKQPRRGW